MAERANAEQDRGKEREGERLFESTCLDVVVQKNPDAIVSPAALILKGIRESLLWSHFEEPWLEITDLSYPKFHIPTWKQFCEVL